MTAASCQFGSMNDTTLPGGIRAISVCASMLARSCSVRQSSRMSPSTKTVRSGVRRAASRSASARVERTHSPRRYASAARAPSILTNPNLSLDCYLQCECVYDTTFQASPSGVLVLASPLRASGEWGLTGTPPTPDDLESAPWPVPTRCPVGPGTDGAVVPTGPQLA